MFHEVHLKRFLWFVKTLIHIQELNPKLRDLVYGVFQGADVFKGCGYRVDWTTRAVATGTVSVHGSRDAFAFGIDDYDFTHLGFL